MAPKSPLTPATATTATGNTTTTTTTTGSTSSSSIRAGGAASRRASTGGSGSGSGATGASSTAAGSSRFGNVGANASAAAVDCLETSLQLLHNSVEHAKAWDFDHRDEMSATMSSCRDKLCDNTNLYFNPASSSSRNHPASTSSTTSNNNNNNNSSSSSWWVSLLQRLQETHMSDRQQWEKDLNKAKYQSQHLKEELRETIEERIAWLEERFLEEIQQQQHKADRRGSKHDGMSRTSTSSSTSESDVEYYGSSRTSRAAATATPSSPRQRFLSARNNNRNRSNAADDRAVEVSYDSALALQRLDELERVVEQQQLEKSELSNVLEHATKVTQQGEQLSASMQQQLQLLLQEVDQTAQKQKKYYREKVATQKRLLQLLEQQHNNTVTEFKHEKELLDTTIVQLTADKSSLQKELDTLKVEHQKEKDNWQRERANLQSVIQQLEGDNRHLTLYGRPRGASPDDEGAFIISSTSGEEYYADDISSIHASTIRPSSSQSPRHKINPKWNDDHNDNFDRAMVERDYFKQEAEQAKRELESIKSNPTSLGSDAGFVKELEKEVQHYKHQLDKELDYYREVAVKSQKELDDYKKKTQKELDTIQKRLKEAESTDVNQTIQQVRNEYKALLTRQEDEMQATITDLTKQLECMDADQRYRDSLEKRNSLAAKLRQMERQRDDDKCEWKLRLETVFSEKSKFLAEKEQLEQRIHAMERQYKSDLKELEETIGQESKKWTECSTGAEEQNQRLKKELEELTGRLEKQQEQLRKERKSWDKVQDEHVKEMEAVSKQLQSLQSKSKREVEQLNVMLAASRMRCDEEVEKIKEKENAINELRSALEASKSENRSLTEKVQKHDENVKSLKMKHKVETSRLLSELQKAKDESRALTDKTNELIHNLDSLRRDHRQTKDNLEAQRKEYRQAKEKWDTDMQRVVEEKNNQILDLRVKCTTLSEKYDQDNASKTDAETVVDVVEELRKDVMSIRETLENASIADKTTASANHIQLSDEIELIQSSLNDALAEITLGSEAMMEVKDLVDEVCRSVKARPDSQTDSQLQTNLVAEIQFLREQLSTVVDNQKDGVNMLNDSIRQELVSELQRKELIVAELKARLEQLQVELLSEREKLASAETEIVTLNDQADAYGEELMRMQAVTAGLEETLRATERKMEDAMRTFDDDGAEWPTKKNPDEDSSPLLDEALALAQGLTDLVHGRDEDADVMDMLQSLSDMMDQHERGEWPPTQRSDDSPESREGPPSRLGSTQQPPDSHRKKRATISSPSSFRVDSHSKMEHTPEPVQSPELSPPSAGHVYPGSAATTTLQTVVEQLYGRCQLLERERNRMMNVTVDLLTSARQANVAELDAALATARRRSAEEILRVRHETQIEKERLYHKLCGKCAQGLLLMHKSAPSSTAASKLGSTGVVTNKVTPSSSTGATKPTANNATAAASTTTTTTTIRG